MFTTRAIRTITLKRKWKLCVKYAFILRNNQPQHLISQIVHSTMQTLFFLIMFLQVYYLLHLPNRTTIEASKHPSEKFIKKNDKSIAAHHTASTLLRMHNIYVTERPHNTFLYDVLRLHPNATSAQINSSYRRLSRDYHPDKWEASQRRENRNGTRNDTTDSEERKEKWREVQWAHEILKEDTTRLVYHRYGLHDPSVAVKILTGAMDELVNERDVGADSGTTAKKWNGMTRIDRMEDRIELWRLMGYHVISNHRTSPISSMHFNDAHSHKHAPPQPAPPPPPPHDNPHEERVRIMATQLIERIRPLVEGTIPECEMVQCLIEQCDRLKSLPLGAQILRCIGRAYRISGKRSLQRLERDFQKGMKATKPKDPFGNPHLATATASTYAKLRDTMGYGKGLLEAAVAGGKLVLGELAKRKADQYQQKQKKEKSRKKKQNEMKSIEYQYSIPDSGKTSWDEYEVEDTGDSYMSSDNDLDYEEKMQCQQMDKARNAILHSLQVEALWKVTKLELDRTSREACHAILSGKYFFNFNTSSSLASSTKGQTNVRGWVGLGGETIDYEEGTFRAAAAMILVGDIMVCRSKEDTAWME